MEIKMHDVMELDTLVALRQRVALLEDVVENYPGGLLLFDKDLRLVFCNQNQKKMLDYPDELFANGPPSIEQIFWLNAHRGEYGNGHAEEQVRSRMKLVLQRVEHVFERTRPNGTILRIKGIPLNGGFVTTYIDITEERKGQSALAYLALHDTLTGLANRVALMSEMKRRLMPPLSNSGGAVIFIDLDKFKSVNDLMGHAAGDELLKMAANRIRRSIRDSDFAARLGGDEFVIVQSDVQDESSVETLARRIHTGICEPYLILGERVRIGASFGIAMFPQHSRKPEELLVLADMSMYRSKASDTPIQFWSAEKSAEAHKARRWHDGSVEQ
jgi:diguanylate cyclase (GGDEF)-like protein